MVAPASRTMCTRSPYSTTTFMELFALSRSAIAAASAPSACLRSRCAAPTAGYAIRSRPRAAISANRIIIRVTNSLFRICYLTKVRLDKGQEFVALTLAEWAERKRIAQNFIEPGRPMQSGFIERFNGSYQRGVLDMHIFRTLSEVREQTEHWLADYNQQIPHDSLGGLTPAEFRDQHQPL